MKTTAEITEGLARPCSVDTGALETGGKKLGLGSSAAALVAALALRAHARGADVTTAPVRDAICTRAREVHSRVQGGGSGVDVAASTYGGALRFTRGRAEPISLPGVRVTAFFSGASARTSTLRERVAHLAEQEPALYLERMSALEALAQSASAAVASGDGALFVSAVAEQLGALGALGRAADAPIVLPAFAALGEVAAAERAAFIPSGAGGGDVGVFVGMKAPSPSFMKRAEALSMLHIPIAVDTRGVHIET